MLYQKELWEIVCRDYPGAVCIGNSCYVPLDSEHLAKAEFISDNKFEKGFRLSVLNRRTGPVDSMTLHSWELPHSIKRAASAGGEQADWDVCRSVPDIEALSEIVEQYFCLFRGAGSEAR